MSGSDDWGPNDHGASLAIQRGIVKDTNNELLSVEAERDHLRNNMVVHEWGAERTIQWIDRVRGDYNAWVNGEGRSYSEVMDDLDKARARLVVTADRTLEPVEDAATQLLDLLEGNISQLQDREELAWGLIANAWDFVERETGPGSVDWLRAAEKWRDRYPTFLGDCSEIVELAAEQLEFHCPDCNGTHFGTSMAADEDGDWIVHCHGDVDRDTCGWSGLHRDHIPGSGRGEVEL